MLRLLLTAFLFLIFLGCSDHNGESSTEPLSSKETSASEETLSSTETLPSEETSSVNTIETKILNITPKGENVPSSNEVVFQFQDDVVPLGKMDRAKNAINIDIKPSLNCEWRWLNRSTLACRLTENKALNLATKYDITVDTRVSNVDDFYLADKFRSSFTTVLPQLRYSSYETWVDPDKPYIRLYFNMPVTKASIEEKILFSKGNATFVNSEIIDAKTVTENGTSRVVYSKDVSDKSTAKQEWIVAPKENLGLNKKILLFSDDGLVSPLGPLAGKAQNIKEIRTFPEFKFIGYQCSINKETSMCNPMNAVGLTFSSPVKTSVLKKALSMVPSLSGNLKDFDPWENTYDYSRLSGSHYENQEYTLWLPIRLKAFTNYQLTLNKKYLRDEFGRTLPENAFQAISMDHRSPRLQMAHSNVVLEKNIDSDIPLYVTNLDNISIAYTKKQADHVSQKASVQIPTQDLTDISYKIKLGIRELLNGKSGVIYGQVSTSSIKDDRPRDIFAQITPFQAHAKIGHFNSLVWITDFKNGHAVAGAKVSLKIGYFDKLEALEKLPYEGITDENGLAHFAGTQKIDKKLKNLGWLYRTDKRFFVEVQKGDDIALLPLDYDFKISSYGTYASMHRYGDHAKAWGTTPQGVYKLGDKVEYKIFVRDQNNTSLISPEKYHFSLKVFDPLDKLVYEEKEFQLNEYGSFNAAFDVPKEGAVGKYVFALEQTRTSETETFQYSWTPMDILVSDFTPASFGVKMELNGDMFQLNDPVKSTTSATMYSGGPYSNAEIRVTGHLFEKRFTSNHPLAKGFSFGGDDFREEELFNIQERLNAKGQLNTEYKLKDTDISYGELLFESSVKDERGKYIASSATAKYSQRDRFVGLKNTKWTYQKGEASTVKVLVVDESGKPVTGTAVKVDIKYQQNKASRVKGPGNAFMTVNSSEWVNESSCDLVSTTDISECQFTPKHVGSYQFTATLKDTHGHEHATTLNAWIIGSGSIVWNQSNDSTLQIIPENDTYQLGQTAKYLVKNPYPGAQALVSIERYGILDSWVQTLETATPVIEVPIKAEYLPGFYLSVTVISPRVDKPLGEGIVDLGKPSYKMGYVSTRVKDSYKELEIDIKTDKKVYEPQEKVNVDIHVHPKTQDPNSNYELAVVVIDESVYALNKKGKSYYDPYLGFNALDTLDVTNFSLLSRLIGRQKFEKKGANQGGDGGKTTAQSSLRDDFKYVAYWNPNVVTDDHGNATVGFTLPDNLTGWKVIVMAVGKNDTMGVSQMKFQSNKSTEVRAVMPNQVLEGDTFSAGFNIMNRTGDPRQLAVEIDVKGVDSKVQKRNVQLEPFERKNIYIPIKAKGHGKLTFTVSAKDRLGADRVEHILDVKRRSSLETMSNFGSTLGDKVIEKVQIPRDIIPNIGEVGVVLSTSVISNVDGAFMYIRDYPYWCWEQRLTKAAAAAQYLQLKDYLPDSLQWDESASLVNRMLNDASSFQAPNGGMAFWQGSNEYVSPYLSVFTALEFQWLKENGYQIPTAVEQKLHEYLGTILSKDSFPSYYSTGMSSTVRAVALNALSKAKAIDSYEVSRYYRHFQNMSLFGKANYLQAMMNVNGLASGMKDDVLNAIISSSSQSAGKFQFNETFDNGSAYLLATPMRTNCAVLTSILQAENDNEIGSKVKGIAPKIVRAVTQTRGNKDHWENTQENIFCMNALVDYAKVYESEPVSMSVQVEYDHKVVGDAAFSSKKEVATEIFTGIKTEDIGQEKTLDITKRGTGRLYYTSRISYAPKDEIATSVNSGIEVHREYSIERNGKFELLHTPISIKQGDIVRVDLFVSLPTARHFVVVNDPIPGGLEAINSQLATSSVMDAKKGEFKASEDSWWFHFSSWSSYGRYNWSFYHKELRHDSARFYSDYLPAGNYHLSYTAQAIAEGEFSVMATHAEEMYDPDVYGKSVPAKLIVSK